MLHFPTKVFNERIGVFVEDFYEEMADLFRRQGWAWEQPRRTQAAWQHPDFVIRVTKRHSDGAVRTLELKALSLPGVTDVTPAGHVTVRNQHCFRVSIPRSYPANLAATSISAVTTLYHPRIDSSGHGHACIYVNGEIDRVLWSIVRQILLDPEYVQPPRLFRGQDRGLNLLAMAWYERDAHGIHKRLLDLWAQAHGADAFMAPDRKAPGVKIEQLRSG